MDEFVAGAYSRWQAENLITRELDGCVVRERYHDNFGSRGESAASNKLKGV